MIVFRAGCPAVSSWLAATLILFACTPSAPGLGGGPATAPAPNNSWVPPDDHPELAETPPAGDSVHALPEDLLPRLQSLALGVVLLAAMLAIMSAVITALPTAWAFLGILGLLALAIPNSYVVSAPARGDVPWLVVGGYVMAMVAAMLFTLSYVRAREY